MEKEDRFAKANERADKILNSTKKVEYTAQEFFVKATKILLDEFSDNAMMFVIGGGIVTTLAEKLFAEEDAGEQA